MSIGFHDFHYLTPSPSLSPPFFSGKTLLEYANYVVLRKPKDRSRTSSGEAAELCQTILNMVVSESARTRRSSSGNRKYVESEHEEEDFQPSDPDSSTKKGAAARRRSSRRASAEARKRQRSTKGRDSSAGDEVVVVTQNSRETETMTHRNVGKMKNSNLMAPESSSASSRSEPFSDRPSTSRRSRR